MLTTSHSRIFILNTLIDNLTQSETLEYIDRRIRENIPLHHVVVNAGKIVDMQKDEKLRNSVNNSDLINADGQAVVWASRFLGKPLKERVTGIDLMKKLIELAAAKGYKVFFFGAREEVVKKVVEHYSGLYGESIVAGYRNGYFTPGEEENIAREIAESGAQMLFVGIKSPVKENFLYRYREILKPVPFIMGVGGSFDVIAGKVKRAPQWMQKNGLEWFYRFIQEPRRMWKRYLFGNTAFVWLVLKEKFSKKHP